MRDTELKQLQDQAAKLNEQIEAELKARAALLALTPTQQLAVFMRENTYARDEDSWYYEFTDGAHNWGGDSHRRWLTRAQRVMAVMRKATKEGQRELNDYMFLDDAKAVYLACHQY